jgi:hypothetical protein
VAQNVSYFCNFQKAAQSKQLPHMYAKIRPICSPWAVTMLLPVDALLRNKVSNCLGLAKNKFVRRKIWPWQGGVVVITIAVA